MKAWIMLADYAQVHAGKLSVVGGGINLVGPGPITMGVAVQVVMPWENRSRRQRLKVALIDGDGHPFMVQSPVGQAPLEVQGDFEVVPSPGSPPGSELPFAFAFNVAGLLLPAGTYIWRLSIQEEEGIAAEAPFAVRAQISSPPQQ